MFLGHALKLSARNLQTQSLQLDEAWWRKYLNFIEWGGTDASLEVTHLVSVDRALRHSSRKAIASDVWQQLQGPPGTSVCLQLFWIQAGAPSSCRAQAEQLFSTSEGVMMWEILVWKSSWANTSICLNIWSGEPAIRHAVLQAHVGKCASQAQTTTLVHTGINPEPSCFSPGAVIWPWLLQSKMKLRQEGWQGTWLSLLLP